MYVSQWSEMMDIAVGRLHVSVEIEEPSAHRDIERRSLPHLDEAERAYRLEPVRRQLERDRLRWMLQAHLGNWRG